ncbi:MAG: 4-phosphoerythronate dehydrogenase [Gammaproteobacteria bacterium]|nr:4-phosphoerythronate dehydrogenase [Gammaproteobacteria bacterium]
MKIVADENIPRVRQAFQDLGEVDLLPGRDIRRWHLLDCQCLVVRTVTPIDANLLQGTPVEFVGTATIGTDHVDLEYLKNNHIAYSNAAGCNAEAASEYVISGLFALSKRKDFDPFTMKAGIVGFGNVGSRLHQKLTALGIECLVNDPPLQQSGQSRQAFVDLDTILQECDFISLHVPLTRSGEFSTYHLLDARQMEKLTKGCLLVNAARGEIVDNLALMLEQDLITLPKPKLWPDGISELEGFLFSVTDSGNIKSSAPSGSHDDCVIALALAAMNVGPHPTDWLVMRI